MDLHLHVVKHIHFWFKFLYIQCSSYAVNCTVHLPVQIAHNLFSVPLTYYYSNHGDWNSKILGSYFFPPLSELHLHCLCKELITYLVSPSLIITLTMEQDFRILLLSSSVRTTIFHALSEQLADFATLLVLRAEYYSTSFPPKSV